MPTNYVLTAGTSVLANIRNGSGLKGSRTPSDATEQLQSKIEKLLDNPDDGEVRDALSHYLNRCAHVKQFLEEANNLTKAEDPLPRIKGSLIKLDDKLSLHRADLSGLSAEAKAIVATTGASGGTLPDVRDVLKEEDTISLVSTDTDEGLAAAILIAWLLAKEVKVRRFGDTRPVLAGDPERIEGCGPARSAEVLVVRWLRADDFVKFREARRPLGQALAWSMKPEMPHHVLLSGGYKAVPPLVIACCEFLNEASPDRTINVGINFEESDDLLELTLRRPPSRWQAALRAKDPSFDQLVDWAYVGQEYTGFGEALMGLLDDRGPIGEE